MAGAEAGKKATTLGILKALAFNLAQLLPLVSERFVDLPAESTEEVTAMLKAWPNEATQRTIASLNSTIVPETRRQLAMLRRNGYPVPREWTEVKLLGDLSADGEFHAGKGEGHVDLRAFIGAKEAVSKLLADVKHAAWEFENAPATEEGRAGANEPTWQPVAEIEQQIESVAPTQMAILLLGETGTGKEHYANRIHRRSDHKMNTFVPINCAMLPKERIDSELFGHVRGAFTGAVQDYAGKIRGAEGGTVFLDELGALPEACWGNLLRFLQNGEIQPLGGKVTTANVRVVAATNKADRLPADVLHRFDVVLTLPPLRARLEDLPVLAKEFFEAAKLKAKNRSSLRFSKGEIEKLAAASYEWPGNIRQLEKAILRAVTLHKGGRALTADEVLEAARQTPDMA